MIEELWEDLERRDERAAELRDSGMKVKRYSLRNKHLHFSKLQDEHIRYTWEEKAWGPEGPDFVTQNTYSGIFPVVYGLRAVAT